MNTYPEEQQTIQTTYNPTKKRVWETKERKSIKPYEIKFKEIEETKRKAIISEKMEIQIKALLEMHKEPTSLEWMGIIKGEKRTQGNTITYHAKEIEIIDQIAEKATVATTAKGAKEITKIKDQIGWIHSHNTMGVFFSGTDEETAETHELSIVVNDNLETYTVATVPITSTETNANGKVMFVEIETELESGKQIQKEIQKLTSIVNEKIHRNETTETKEETTEKEKIKTEYFNKNEYYTDEEEIEWENEYIKKAKTRDLYDYL